MTKLCPVVKSLSDLYSNTRFPLKYPSIDQTYRQTETQTDRFWRVYQVFLLCDRRECEELTRSSELEIILSIIQDPNLDPKDLMVTGLLIPISLPQPQNTHTHILCILLKP